MTSESMHIVVKVVAQVGPDEWETEPVIIPVTDSTTIADIRVALARRRALSRPGYSTVATLVMMEAP